MSTTTPEAGTVQFISTKAAIIHAMKRVVEVYSEENYAAGWYLGIEHMLYEDSRHHPSPNADAACLRELGDLIGGWVYWDSTEHEALFLPWSSWQRRHKLWRSTNFRDPARDGGSAK